jgi:hypothetical protein
MHAVEMLTALLRLRGHTVLSFVENNHGENDDPDSASNSMKKVDLNEWILSDQGRKSFEYDTNGATKSDLVIYISPSGCDAWAEVGAAWGSKVLIVGLRSKGEQVGLMRRLVTTWCDNYRELLLVVDGLTKLKGPPCPR